MGLVGNLLMGVVLLRNSLNTNFHQTIVALTVVNLLFVVMIVVDSFHPDLNLENQLYIRLFPYLWHPVKAILLCCETYLVMSITMERYLAVKLPVRLHMVNLHHHSHFRHFATFILPPIAVAFLVTTFNLYFGALVFATLALYLATLSWSKWYSKQTKRDHPFMTSAHRERRG